MKLSIVIGVLNQFELSCEAIRLAIQNANRPEDIQLIVIDNGSDSLFIDYLQGLPEMSDVRQAIETVGFFDVVRNDVNTGNYPMFDQARGHARGDVVAFFHSDVFVWQKGWDEQVLAQFEGQPQLGLMGFIGSTELDNWGGRGMGTISNMQGRAVKKADGGEWRGSAGAIHGKVSSGMTIDGSVVDGCVMIFRRSVLEQLPMREDYPPHHFYDRLMSAQVIELGFKIGILGIEFDHVSGQVANTQSKWQATSAEWFKLKHGIDTPQQWAEKFDDWVKRGNSPSKGKVPDQWDYCAYLEAERLFLQEYRDQKHLVPIVYGRRV